MYNQLKICPLLAQSLGPFRVIPDIRQFQFTFYFDQAFAALVIVKDTPSALRCAREVL